MLQSHTEVCVSPRRLWPALKMHKCPSTGFQLLDVGSYEVWHLKHTSCSRHQRHHTSLSFGGGLLVVYWQHHILSESTLLLMNGVSSSNKEVQRTRLQVYLRPHHSMATGWSLLLTYCLSTSQAISQLAHTLDSKRSQLQVRGSFLCL